MLWLYIVIFLVSIFFLVFSGKKAVQSLTRISRFLEIREFVVAFILMAFATSVPEFFVGISAALHGIPELSLGNILGANIINLSLAVGLVVLFLGGLEVERETAWRGSILMTVIGLLPLLLVLDGTMSRIDGVILLLVFIFYVAWLFDREEFFKKIFNNMKLNFLNYRIFLKDIAILGGSIVLLLISSQGIVKSAAFFAEFLGIGLGVIGIILVAAGTALPEVYFSIRAGRAGEDKMILGNLMGCVIITSTLVLGIVALIHPIKVSDFSPFAVARFFLVISALFFLFFVRNDRKISRKEGVFLLSLYASFVIVEILMR